MYFKQPRKRKAPEKEGAIRLIDALRRNGFTPHRLNVSAGTFSTPGFPDYFFTIPLPRLLDLLEKHNPEGKKDPLLLNNTRWIETKISYEAGGRLSASQVERFTQFAKDGVGVWVLYDENDWVRVLRAPNWGEYLWR